MQLSSEKRKDSRASVLMVDDNLKNLQVLGNILNNENYKLEYALNGNAALEWVEKKDFDLILLDVVMPEMGGFEFCSIFKSNEKNMNVPVIFLTAQTDVNSIIQGFNLGGVDYINKPFNKQELLARVSTHLELKKSRDIIQQNALELELKNKLINYSLIYSEKIQNAVLLNGNKSLDRFRESFIIFKPKEIISGDFYWSYINTDKIIIALMDCTGHGIPGALMSMLGITFLNEIVISESIDDPGEILNRLRERVINILGQKGIIAEVHDGMDGAIITINRNLNKLCFSGAFNSLYIIREGNLIIHKGDNMPIGHYQKMRKFTPQEFTILKDDLIYLFTDGYSDQFGGEKNKKFKIRSFRDLILSVHKKPINMQKEILEQHFKEWRGKQEQVDDVTVLGLRI
jgi:phosphoserine phosphatase RsbU/P